LVTHETDREVYLRGVEETCHHSRTLRQADGAPVCEAIGFRVFREEDLDLAKKHFDVTEVTADWFERPFQSRTLRVSDREPLTVYACHCTECQRQSGSAFSLSMIVPREGVAIVAGEPKEWLRRTDSGRMVSCMFCDDCGVRLYHNPKANEAITVVKAGTLDDPSWLRPVGHIWTRSAQRWFAIPAKTISYGVQPPDLYRLIEAWSAQRQSSR
jgi:hypothetical protein